MARILFADDQAGLFYILTEELKAKGHEVTVIKKAAEAYDYIGLFAADIDLLIVDWSFPGERLNGGDILKFFRDQSASPAILFSNSSAVKPVADEFKAEFAGKDTNRAVELVDKLLA